MKIAKLTKTEDINYSIFLFLLIFYPSSFTPAVKQIDFIFVKGKFSRRLIRHISIDDFVYSWFATEVRVISL